LPDDPPCSNCATHLKSPRYFRILITPFRA
jgi:hypothetical protein